jgi:hypothetical protein
LEALPVMRMPIVRISTERCCELSVVVGGNRKATGPIPAYIQG